MRSSSSSRLDHRRLGVGAGGRGAGRGGGQNVFVGAEVPRARVELGGWVGWSPNFWKKKLLEVEGSVKSCDPKVLLQGPETSKCPPSG